MDTKSNPNKSGNISKLPQDLNPNKIPVINITVTASLILLTHLFGIKNFTEESFF